MLIVLTENCKVSNDLAGEEDISTRASKAKRDKEKDAEYMRRWRKANQARINVRRRQLYHQKKKKK